MRSETRECLSNEADKSFGSNGSGKSRPDLYTEAPEVSPRPANDDEDLFPGCVAHPVDDLDVYGSRGELEGIAYHLYLGRALRKAGCLLVVRFATRTVIVKGRRLEGYAKAFQRRGYVGQLRLSTRAEMMRARSTGKPEIHSIDICTPKAGEIMLDAALEEQDAQEALRC